MKVFKPALIFLLILLAACQREAAVPDVPEDRPGLIEHTLYASTPGGDAPGTRTALNPDNDKKILWSPREDISIFSAGVNYAFHGDNETAAASASFTGLAPAELGEYIALYPYNSSASYADGYVSTTLPASQTGKAGSFGDGYLLTADDASGDNVSFNHLCSGLRFMVNRDDITAVSMRGNNGEKIAGDFRFRFTSADTPAVEEGTEEIVTLTAPGGHFETGKYYYIVILPTTFTKGFTLYADDGTRIGALSFNSNMSFARGAFKNVDGNLDVRMGDSWSIPKLYYGPENSFCIRPSETVAFDVSPRLIDGVWHRSGVSFPASAPDGYEVLWGGSSISSVSLSDGELSVTASATPGSSLVSIKKGEAILWSFLIWVTASAPAEATLPGGAKLLPALGGECYFQWGRKDPLVSGRPVMEHPGDAAAHFASIRNPGSFINEGTNCADWYAAERYEHQDSLLWGGAGGAKTVWDPCPAGWRVPRESDFEGLTESYADKFEKLGVLLPDGAVTAPTSDYGWDANCWARNKTDNNSWYLLMQTDGEGFQGFSIEGNARYQGLSVRCIKEKE